MWLQEDVQLGVFAISVHTQKPGLVIKSSRDVFMLVFYTTDTESLFSLNYGSHGLRTA